MARSTFFIPYHSLYSFTFDGVNERINIGNSMDVTGNCAVSLWVKLNALGVTTTFFYVVNAGKGNVNYFSVGQHSANVILASGDNTTAASKDSGSFVLGTGVWYHVVVNKTSTPGIASIYINGSEVTDAAANFNSGLTEGGAIGANAAGTGVLNGNIDEVTFWNANLSATDITNLYARQNPLNHAKVANLKGWWKMGESATYGGTNWTLVDSSGNGYTGTSVNMEVGDRQTDVP